jgi:hypothetical protein
MKKGKQTEMYRYIGNENIKLMDTEIYMHTSANTDCAIANINKRLDAELVILCHHPANFTIQFHVRCILLKEPR